MHSQKFSSRFPRSCVISSLINTPITAKHEIFKHSLIVDARSSTVGSGRYMFPIGGHRKWKYNIQNWNRIVWFNQVDFNRRATMNSVEWKELRRVMLVSRTFPCEQYPPVTWSLVPVCAQLLSEFCCAAIALD